MAAKANISDLDFALLCMKETPAKPDFDAIAQRLGCDKKQVYQRHYALMKKAPTIVDGAVLSSTPVTPMTDVTAATPKKRSRPTKKQQTAVEIAAAALGYHPANVGPNLDDAVVDESPTKKKAKVSADGEETKDASDTLQSVDNFNAWAFQNNSYPEQDRTPYNPFREFK